MCSVNLQIFNSSINCLSTISLIVYLTDDTPTICLWIGKVVRLRILFDYLFSIYLMIYKTYCIRKYHNVVRTWKKPRQFEINFLHHVLRWEMMFHGNEKPFNNFVLPEIRFIIQLKSYPIGFILWCTLCEIVIMMHCTENLFLLIHYKLTANVHFVMCCFLCLSIIINAFLAVFDITPMLQTLLTLITSKWF